MDSTNNLHWAVDKGYTPEMFPIEQLRECLPSFVPLTRENTNCNSFGSDVSQHEYFASPPGRTVPLEEIREMVEEEAGKLPENGEEWELMKARAQRRNRRAQSRYSTKE